VGQIREIYQHSFSPAASQAVNHVKDVTTSDTYHRRSRVAGIFRENVMKISHQLPVVAQIPARFQLAANQSLHTLRQEPSNCRQSNRTTHSLFDQVAEDSSGPEAKIKSVLARIPSEDPSLHLLAQFIRQLWLRTLPDALDWRLPTFVSISA